MTWLSAAGNSGAASKRAATMSFLVALSSAALAAAIKPSTELVVRIRRRWHDNQGPTAALETRWTLAALDPTTAPRYPRRASLATRRSSRPGSLGGARCSGSDERHARLVLVKASSRLAT